MNVDTFFYDMNSVMSFLFNKIARRFFLTFYRSDKAYYLFLTALLPFILMFCFDIIMSFILSVRSRQFRFFNVLSPKSWRTFNSTAYNSLPPDRLKAATPSNRHSSTFTNIFSPYIYRVNDTIRCRSGVHAIYLGTRFIDGKKAYLYKVGGKVYSSNLRPARFCKFYTANLQPIKRGKFQLNIISNKHYYGSNRDDKK